MAINGNFAVIEFSTDTASSHFKCQQISFEFYFSVYLELILAMKMQRIEENTVDICFAHIWPK